MKPEIAAVHPSKARRPFAQRSALLLVGLACVAITSLNCGVGFPPRLWKCQCRQVCLDKAGQQNALEQYACGYSRTQATQFAEHYCTASVPNKLAGCRRVACSCSGCKVSRQQICRRRPGSRRGLGAFVSVWVTSLFDLDNDGFYDDDWDDEYDDDLYDDDFFEPDDPEEPGPPPGYMPVPSHTPPPGYDAPSGSGPSGSSSGDDWSDPNDDWSDPNDDWSDPDDTWSDPGDDDWTDDSSDDDWTDEDEDW